MDEPPGSGGLLAALHQFKLLLTEGQTAFTEFAYYGSRPLDGRGPSVDVIVTRKSTVECHWYFRVSDGSLVGVDSSLGTDVDPCQLRFLQYSDFQGRHFPSRFSVRYGDTDYGTFELLTIDVTAVGDALN